MTWFSQAPQTRNNFGNFADGHPPFGDEDCEEETVTTSSLPSSGPLAKLAIASAHQLMEPNLPRMEVLVRILEQTQEQAALIHQIEHQLSLAKESVRTLRWAANALRFPSLLPGELLGHIMELACGFDYRSEGELAQDFRLPIWLSHVCQHWRAVAVPTPSLWSLLPLDNITITGAFLPRTGDGPIDMKLHNLELTASQCISMRKMLRRHAYRMRSLRLTVNQHCMAAFARGLRSIATPRLEYLFLEATSSRQLVLTPP